MLRFRILLLCAAVTLASFSTIEAKKTKSDAFRQKVEQLLFSEADIPALQAQISESLHQRQDSMPVKQLRKLEKYLTGDEFIRDFVDLYDNALRPALTEEELDKVIAFQTADSTKLIAQKAVAFAQSLQTENSPAMGVMKDFITGMVSALAGEEVAVLDESADPAYANSFHAYYNASGTDKMMESYMSNIFGAIINQVGDAAQTEEVQPMVKKLTNYMTENLEPAVMRMMEGFYTKQDFDYFTRGMANETYQKYIDAAANVYLGSWIINLIDKMK